MGVKIMGRLGSRQAGSEHVGRRQVGNGQVGRQYSCSQWAGNPLARGQ